METTRPEQSKVREALTFVRGLDLVSLPRFRVVGSCVRYDESVRNQMKDLKQKIVDGLQRHTNGQENYLIWGPSGSGKTYFVQQIAHFLQNTVCYEELNLARLDEQGFRLRLANLEKADKPVLCLVDEMDSKPLETWPYEALLPQLDPGTPRKPRACFVLAGSSGSDMTELKGKIKARQKGIDLLCRIPDGNECTVPALTVGDKILVVLCQLTKTARELGSEICEVEKLALFYIALNSRLSNARQLRELAVSCIGRIPKGEDRVKYDYLFNAGDPENKRFWQKWYEEGLDNSFVTVEDDQIHERRQKSGGSDQIYNQVARFLEKEIREDFAVGTDHANKPSHAQPFSKDDLHASGFKRLAILFYETSTKSALEGLRERICREETRSKKDLPSTDETSLRSWSRFPIQPYSEGTLDHIFRRYEGLLSDYALLKKEWLSASNAFRNSDVLPNVFKRSGPDSEIRYYSNIVIECLNAIQNVRKHSAQRLVDLSIMKWAIDQIAKIVSTIKSGYSQRVENTDQFNANLLVAADNVARNYLEYLKLFGMRWDGFVTLTEYFGQRGRAFGLYTPLRRFFHLSLSSDVKYNVQQMIVLAHEIGHAVCQTRVSLVDKQEVFFVFDEALYYIDPLKRKLAEIVRNYCENQSAYSRICSLRRALCFFETNEPDLFISEMARSEIGLNIYEGLVDIVSLHLAGASYLKALMNYAYEPVVSREYYRTNRLKVNPRFFDALLRISMCTAYAYTTLPREMRNLSGKYFEECQKENEVMLKDLYKRRAITIKTCDTANKCSKCVAQIGVIIGARFAVYDKEILEDLFYSKRSAAFSTDKDLVQAVMDGKEILNEEPRKILNAFCQIKQGSERTCSSSVIRSLALARRSYETRHTVGSGKTIKSG